MESLSPPGWQYFYRTVNIWYWLIEFRKCFNPIRINLKKGWLYDIIMNIHYLLITFYYVFTFRNKKYRFTEEKWVSFLVNEICFALLRNRYVNLLHKVYNTWYFIAHTCFYKLISLLRTSIVNQYHNCEFVINCSVIK